MLVVLDNYDSFTYNLVQYFQELGAEVTVFRNDEISVPDLATMDMSHLVISPGPGRPEQAGEGAVAAAEQASRSASASAVSARTPHSP